MNLGKPIAKGNTAEIYLSDGKIVKVFLAGIPGRAAEKEAGKQRAVYAAGLPVPAVFEVTQVNGRPAIVMEYAEGTAVGERMLRNPTAVRESLALSVDIQIQMHTKTVPGLESMWDKLAVQLREAGALREEVQTELLRRLCRIPRDGRLCHGDFHVLNLIQTEDKTVIIDWVDASAGSPYADVCRTYLLYALFAPEWPELYLDLYCEKSGAFRDDILAWAPVVAGARLSERVSPEEEARLQAIIRRYL